MGVGRSSQAQKHKSISRTQGGPHKSIGRDQQRHKSIGKEGPVVRSAAYRSGAAPVEDTRIDSASNVRIDSAGNTRIAQG